MTESNVDLPCPLGPKRATVSCSFKVKLTPFKISLSSTFACKLIICKIAIIYITPILCYFTLQMLISQTKR